MSVLGSKQGHAVKFAVETEWCNCRSHEVGNKRYSLRIR